MKSSQTKKLTIAAVLTAIAVLGSFFSFPVFGSKCAPIQHFVNVTCAILLGPWWGVGVAFAASFIRNVTGLGTLLAFPGSMCGALLAGLLYHMTKKLYAAFAGEVFGTAILGGMIAFPFASWIMGMKSIALFTFVVPFLISTCGGTILAAVVMIPLKQTGILSKTKQSIN